jgi:hypothetical protein
MKKSEEKKEEALPEIEEGEEDDEQELERIEGVSAPKYKIVYSYPVDMQECWEMPNEYLKDRKFPVSMRVNIELPFIDSVKDAELDINDETLMFKYPDVYDLMIRFKYIIDPDKGKAKFEKDK